MRASSGYTLIRDGCLQREPSELGSPEWWAWFRECCKKDNPYKRYSPEWRLWRKRLQTNPFRKQSYSWHQWNDECCVRPSERRNWICCPPSLDAHAHDATECLEREPERLGTQEWWNWWYL